MRLNGRKILFVLAALPLLSGCTEILSFGVGFGAGYATHYFIAQNQQPAANPSGNSPLAQRTLSEMRRDTYGAPPAMGMAQYPPPQSGAGYYAAAPSQTAGAATNPSNIMSAPGYGTSVNENHNAAGRADHYKQSSANHYRSSVPQRNNYYDTPSQSARQINQGTAQTQRFIPMSHVQRLPSPYYYPQPAYR